MVKYDENRKVFIVDGEELDVPKGYTVTCGYDLHRDDFYFKVSVYLGANDGSGWRHGRIINRDSTVQNARELLHLCKVALYQFAKT